MKTVIVVLSLAALVSACGTVGGAISGAGQDLQQVGDWIKPKGR
jgi:predicted small secreted protein